MPATGDPMLQKFGTCGKLSGRAARCCGKGKRLNFGRRRPLLKDKLHENDFALVLRGQVDGRRTHEETSFGIEILCGF